MTDSRWDRLAEGIDCPLCAPRPASSEYMDFVATLSISSLYLSTDQTYRGLCGLIFDPRHVVLPDQLTPAEWGAFSADLQIAQAAVVRAVSPDHMNIAALGNTMPHLHWGIVPRFRHDPRWGSPIWGATDERVAKVQLLAGERDELVQQLRSALSASNQTMEPTR